MSLNVSVDAIVAEIDDNKLVSRRSVSVKVGNMEILERDEGKEKIAEEKALEEKLGSIATSVNKTVSVDKEKEEKEDKEEKEEKKEEKALEDSADDMII